MQTTTRPTLTLGKRPVAEAAPVDPPPAPASPPTTPAPPAPTPTPASKRQSALSPVDRQRRNKAKGEAALAVLQAAYPTLFTHPVPLALGIAKELTEARRAGTLAVTAIPMRHALVGWFNSDDYIACLAAGGFRIGLDGQPIEPVSPEHIAAAVATLRKRQKKAEPVEVG
ncbi:ProP expression regulator [Caballeronia choica]|jgi:ProP effector|uniref:ProP expression regulator n=1 Tax=Caballeronia choica TaxID=326476 RepID=A0A158L2A1_9BURK|nr:ProQ/FinO family protein [Caballeronia choica]SAL87149.1 ProP expression regulator [Caballeronia choica]